jgi:hypothetical protein
LKTTVQQETLPVRRKAIPMLRKAETKTIDKAKTVKASATLAIKPKIPASKAKQEKLEQIHDIAEVQRKKMSSPKKELKLVMVKALVLLLAKVIKAFVGKTSKVKKAQSEKMMMKDKILTPKVQEAHRVHKPHKVDKVQASTKRIISRSATK